MKKIVLTGGGTAGHVYPALALVDYLKDFEIHYIGSSGIEKEILKNYKNISFHEIPTVKLVRKLTFKNLLIPFKLFNSIKKAKKILREINPDIIFSKGGFVSVPVVFAAKSLKIKVVSHESDLSMGLANKLILKKCDVMCTTFLQTSKLSPKCIWTGQPIRKSLLQGNPSTIKSQFSFKKPILLVIGGSLGAKFLNDAVRNNLDKLTNEFNIIHLTGKDNKSHINNESLVELEYANNMGDIYSACDIVLSRAGSGVINELLAIRKPMLLIPLSKRCSRGDQIENALLFQKLGYAKVIQEEEYTPEKLINNLKNLMELKEKYKNNMKKSNANQATESIVKIINDNIKP